VDIRRESIAGEGFEVPAVWVTPPNPAGAAVIVHGYGGCKEEMLALAWRVAECGLAACAIDLRGHGQHALDLDENVPLDVAAAVQRGRSFGPVTAIGHSLGGRLALTSDAGHAIALSPALDDTFSPQTQEILRSLRSFRVRERFPLYVLDIMPRLPMWQPHAGQRAAIVFGASDIPEIVAACRRWASAGARVVEIEQAHHGDILFLERTFDCVTQQLRAWYGMA
jgi:hypothetical protein